MFYLIVFFLAAAHLYSTEKNIKTIHVYTALCDNRYQGIVPVNATLGNGQDPYNNLYWGALYGVRSYFDRSTDWRLVKVVKNPDADSVILERCVFEHNSGEYFLVAEAYNGREIKRAVNDFVTALRGYRADSLLISIDSQEVSLPTGSRADLVVYVGHNGLMDFRLDSLPENRSRTAKEAIILCCASKYYFSRILTPEIMEPLVWTNGLMAPEAYVLKGALDGWVRGEADSEIRERAAEAYDRYQHCGLNAARRLLVSGW